MEFIIVIGWIEGGYCLVGYLKCDMSVTKTSITKQRELRSVLMIDGFTVAAMCK